MEMPARMRQAQERKNAKDCGTCGTGTSGCDKGGCGPKALAEVAPLGPIQSVKVQALDDEHAVCAAALQQLAQSPTPAALEKVIEAYQAHFAHEEALLDQYVFDEAATGGGFSAASGKRKSHFADHKRLLGELKGALGSSTVPASVVDMAFRGFEAHANTYDNYGEQLEAALRAEEDKTKDMIGGVD